MLNFTAFGGSPIGDNAAAWTKILAAVAASSGGERIYIPAGKYTSSASPQLAYPNRRFSVSIVGDGADVTILNFPSTNGLVLVAASDTHSAHVRDLCFTCNVRGNVGLSINNSFTLGAFGESEIENCSFRGDDSAPGSVWADAVAVTGMCGVKYDGLLVLGGGNYGNGVVLDTGGVPGPNNASIVHDFSKCKFFGCGAGIVYGSVQGVTVDQCNFTNGVTGIWGPTNKTNLGQLAVSNSQLNTTGSQVLMQSSFTNFLASNNMVMVAPNNVGFFLNCPGNWASIVGNQFTGTASTSSGFGIVAFNGFNNGNVVGNIFFRLAYGGDFHGSSNWNTAQFNSANIFNGVTTPLVV